MEDTHDVIQDQNYSWPFYSKLWSSDYKIFGDQADKGSPLVATDSQKRGFEIEASSTSRHKENLII